MGEHELRISEESRSALQSYEALPRNDERRIELFSFLAQAIEDPSGVPFEGDDEGLRWTWLQHVNLVWRLNLVEGELDVIDAWASDD